MMMKIIFLIFTFLILFRLCFNQYVWSYNNVPNYVVGSKAVNGYSYATTATIVTYTVTSNVPVDVYFMLSGQFPLLQAGQAFSYITYYPQVTNASATFTVLSQLQQGVTICAYNTATTGSALVSYNLAQYYTPGSPLSAGAIIGIVVGVFFIIFIFAILCGGVFHRRRYYGGWGWGPYGYGGWGYYSGPSYGWGGNYGGGGGHYTQFSHTGGGGFTHVGGGGGGGFTHVGGK